MIFLQRFYFFLSFITFVEIPHEFYQIRSSYTIAHYTAGFSIYYMSKLPAAVFMKMIIIIVQIAIEL